MTVGEFAGICAVWLFLCLLAHVVCWITGASCNGEELICRRLRSAIVSAKEAISCAGRGNVKAKDIQKGVRTLRRKCVKADRGFKIHMIDNPDDKSVESLSLKFKSGRARNLDEISRMMVAIANGKVGSEVAQGIKNELVSVLGLLEETYSDMWQFKESGREGRNGKG